MRTNIFDLFTFFRLYVILFCNTGVREITVFSASSARDNSYNGLVEFYASTCGIKYSASKRARWILDVKAFFILNGAPKFSTLGGRTVQYSQRSWKKILTDGGRLHVYIT